MVVGTVVAVSIDEDCVTEKYDLKMDALRPVHYLERFIKRFSSAQERCTMLKRYDE